MKTLCVLLLVAGVALPAVQGCEGDFVGLSGSCLKVVIAAGPIFSGKFPVKWQKAREECQALGADLAILDDPAKVEHLNDHILSTVSSTGQYSYWVGGQKVDGLWRWVNGQRINLMSNVWVPNQPKKDQEPAFAILVPADRTHGRLYLNQGGPTTQAPAYICERF